MKEPIIGVPLLAAVLPEVKELITEVLAHLEVQAVAIQEVAALLLARVTHRAVAPAVQVVLILPAVVLPVEVAIRQEVAAEVVAEVLPEVVDHPEVVVVEDKDYCIS